MSGIHADHSCPTWGWRFQRLWVRRCPDCGTWWKAEPVHLSGWGGNWKYATRLGVWWAIRRGRVVGAEDFGAKRERPCVHCGAVPVEDLAGETVAHLCTDCGDQLPAQWKISLTDLFFDPSLICNNRRRR